MAKRQDAVAAFSRAQRWDITRVFAEAAAWLFKSFGKKIKKGEVIRARKRYVKEGRIPNFLSQFITAGAGQNVIA